jgi:hypothetical protein
LMVVVVAAGAFVVVVVGAGVFVVVFVVVVVVFGAVVVVLGWDFVVVVVVGCDVTVVTVVTVVPAVGCETTVVTVVVGVGCVVTVVVGVPWLGRVHRCLRWCARRLAVTVTWGSMDRTVGGDWVVVTVVWGNVVGVSDVVGAGSGRMASVALRGSPPADFRRCWPPKPTRREAMTAATSPNVASGTKIRLRTDWARACFGRFFFAPGAPCPGDFGCVAPYETSGVLSSKLIPVVILRRRFGTQVTLGV